MLSGLGLKYYWSYR